MKSNRDPKKPNVWERLVPNNMASYFLEQAEVLSKEGKFQKSAAAFRQAAKLFGDAERFLNVKDWEVTDAEERDLIEKTMDLARLKGKYCLARVDLEEAKRRRMRGDYASSIEKYASATEKFEEIVEELKRRALSGAHVSLYFENMSGRGAGQSGNSSEMDTLLGFIYGHDSMLKVVPERMNKVSTGYGPLDGLLFGGIPERYAVILTSPSCDERDTLIKGFLENDAEHWVTFYVSTDVDLVRNLLAKYLSNLHILLCGPQSDLIASEFENVYGVRNVEDLSSINISLFSALGNLEKQKPVKGQRICLNILSDVLLRCKTLTTRKWLSDLIPRLKAKGFTIMAILNPYMHSREEASAIIDLFDGQIEMYGREDQDKARVFLRVKRMLGQSYVRREIVMSRDELLRV